MDLDVLRSHLKVPSFLAFGRGTLLAAGAGALLLELVGVDTPGIAASSDAVLGLVEGG